MSKKGLLVLVLVVVLAGGLPAEESFFSIGGGVLGDLEFTSSRGERPGSIADLNLITDTIGLGGWIFADAKYTELSIGLYGGPLSCQSQEWYEEDSDININDYEGSFFAMDFTLLGKYPFVLGKSGISIFPLLGIGYQLVIAATLEDYDIDTPSDFSSFRIFLGVGSDFAFGEKFFIRTSLLGLYRFSSKMENDFADVVNAIPGSSFRTFGWGGMLKIAFGVKL